MTACLGRRVAELADGRLSGVDLQRALAHVAVCASCRDAFETQQAMRGRLGSSSAPGPSAAFLARLAHVPDSTPAVDPAVRARQARGRHRRRVVAAGASLAVLAVAVAGGLTSMARAPQPGPVAVPALASFAAEHDAVSGSLPLGGPALSAPGHQDTVALTLDGPGSTGPSGR